MKKFNDLNNEELADFAQGKCPTCFRLSLETCQTQNTNVYCSCEDCDFETYVSPEFQSNFPQVFADSENRVY